MDTEQLRDEADRLACISRDMRKTSGNTRWAFMNMVESVARHVLAEMDAALADWAFFQSIGGSLHADGPDFKYAAIRTDSAWCRLQTDEDGLGFYAAFRGKGEGFNIINPTRGQVLTALRLFGIPVKRSET